MKNSVRLFKTILRILNVGTEIEKTKKKTDLTYPDGIKMREPKGIK